MPTGWSPTFAMALNNELSAEEITLTSLLPVFAT